MPSSLNILIKFPKASEINLVPLRSANVRKRNVGEVRGQHSIFRFHDSPRSVGCIQAFIYSLITNKTVPSISARRHMSRNHMQAQIATKTRITCLSSPCALHGYAYTMLSDGSHAMKPPSNTSLHDYWRNCGGCRNKAADS